MPASQLDTHALRLDSDHMINQIESFAKDLEAARDELSLFEIPADFSQCSNIVLAGMGGSGAANEMIKELAFLSDVGIEVVHDYTLPGNVSGKTLVIVSSYSGDTEESLSCLESACKSGAKAITITTGGKIAKMSAEHDIPCLKFSYASQPRMAFPYLFAALLVIFSKLGFYDPGDNYTTILRELAKQTASFSRAVVEDQNLAKQLAAKIFQKLPLVYSSPLLKSCGLRFKTILNENSNTIACADYYPELNHNSIAGYTQPKIPAIVIQIESCFDSERIKLRQIVTEEILKRNNIEVVRVALDNPSSQLLEHLVFVNLLDATSYYLALLYDVDPSKTPYIDYIKSRLS